MWTRLITLGIICFSFVNALDKPGKNHTAPQYGKNTFKNKEPAPKKCTDLLSGKYCKQNAKFCDRNKMMRKYCKRTCGWCPEVSPLPCQVSKYGCCWDKINRATGPFQQGCPKCEDKYSKCAAVLQLQPKACVSSLVKKLCASTCGICPAFCEDDPKQASFCPFFKSGGFCKNSKPLMEIMCKRTCSLC